ncbi:hypothetical protein C8J95_104108 [Elizabethkingia sp. YR214]|uniref:hypothetical protein n=1 Tax=Elizabethkingia sp. YR214 TaxID=2135667 RepID=UPI000D32547F|nr:hypothetical protein [Elizabethkingia sp. YR214]PUB32707.1 hypothetical protein C8J95_104108 [Elizabethkingia sp. YR214]
MKKEMNNNETTQEKSAYMAPTLEVTMIRMEQGIAAGSATVKPGDLSGNISHEWDTDPERDEGIDW